MEQRRTFETILEQALAEADAVHTPGTEFSRVAEVLADSLYRLCIEFGVAWNDFKRAMMAEVLDQSESAEGESAKKSDAPMLGDYETRIPLIIFALELMSEDSDL